ncbi:pentapeptide repeat-containing protein [Mesorhizobium sp. A623]
MKDSLYLSNILSEPAVSGIEALAGARAATFQQLVKLAGLDPARDFQNADLRNIDLTDSDLRGFNFSGADLRGAIGIRVQWDDTTIFDNAELSVSIFAAKIRLKVFFDTDERANTLLTSISRQSWSDKILWASQNLLTSGRHHDVALPITEALFYQAKDDEFLQAELMRYLAPRMQAREELHDMLVAALSDEPKSAVVIRSAFSILQRKQLTSAANVRQQVLMLVKSRKSATQEAAVQFLMRNHPTHEEIGTIKSAAEASGGFLEGLYVAELTRLLGGAYEIVTRNPVSNATLPMKSMISASDLRLIARRWLRAESSRNAVDVELPLLQRNGGGNYFTRVAIDERTLRVQELWSKLKRAGIDIQVEGDAVSTVHGTDNQFVANR